MRVTDEDVYDSKALPDLIENIITSDGTISTGKLIADCTYDSNDIFRYLSDNGIIMYKSKKNARVR
ncbi:MAG TPA: transposase [Candidatus Nitrosocosmicus sp.]